MENWLGKAGPGVAASLAVGHDAAGQPVVAEGIPEPPRRNRICLAWLSPVTPECSLTLLAETSALHCHGKHLLELKDAVRSPVITSLPSFSCGLDLK